jgi:hypothetical protein
VLGAGLALVVAGCGGDDQAATQAAGGAPPRGAGAMFTGANLTKLAGELGVSKPKLQAALKTALPARGQRPPSGGQPPSGNGQPPADGQAPPQGARPPGGGGNIAAALAKQLNLSEAKVRKALAKVMPQGGRPPGAQPSGTTTPS